MKHDIEVKELSLMVNRWRRLHTGIFSVVAANITHLIKCDKISQTMVHKRRMV